MFNNQIQNNITKEELITEDIHLKDEIRTENRDFEAKKHTAACRHRYNLNEEHARYDTERRELEVAHGKAIDRMLSRRDEISLELAKMRIAENEAG